MLALKLNLGPMVLEYICQKALTPTKFPAQALALSLAKAGPLAIKI